MTIIGQRWAGKVRNVWYDSSGLGLLHSFDLITEGGGIMIMPTYWPSRNTVDEGSLWQRTADHIVQRAQGARMKPIAFLKDMVDRRLAKALEQGHAACMLGDFNAEWGHRSSSVSQNDTTFTQWATEIGWTNHTQRMIRERDGVCHTYYHGSTPTSSIDHILFNDSIHGEEEPITKVTEAGVSDELTDGILSDHRLLWTTVDLPFSAILGASGKALPGHRAIDLKLSNREMCEDFTAMLALKVDELETPTDCEGAFGTIAALEAAMVATVEELSPPPRKQGLKNGWSPEMMIRKMCVAGLMKIQRHLWGHRHLTRWTDGEVTRRTANTAKDTLQRIFAKYESDRMPKEDIRMIAKSIAQLGKKEFIAHFPRPYLTDLVRDLIAREKRKLHGRARL